MIRKQWDIVLVFIALLAGASLLFSHLDGVIYIFEDEARTLTLLSSGPGIYLLSRPIFNIFRSQASVFYWVAFLHWIGIIIFYFMARMAYGRVISAWSTLFFSVYFFRIDYARLLYPAAYTDLFFLLSLLFCFLSFTRRRAGWMIGTGVWLACAFFVHPFAYTFILGLGLGCLFLFASSSQVFKASDLLPLFLRGLLGFLLAFFFIERLLFLGFKFDFIHNLIKFQIDTVAYKEILSAADYNYLPFYFSRMLRSPFGMVVFCVVFSSLLVTAWHAIKNRSRVTGFFFIVALTSAGLLMLMTYFGNSPSCDRHFVWLVPFYVLSLGNMAAFLTSNRARWIRAAATFLLLTLFLFFYAESRKITRQTFSIKPILRTLRENGIEKSRLLTCWKLYERGELRVARLIPISKEKNRYKIYWKAIFNDYQAGLCDYILTSGLEERSDLGADDLMLKYVTPIASWPHPYRTGTHRSYYRDTSSGNIGLYRLSDIFSRENYFKLRQANQVLAS